MRKRGKHERTAGRYRGVALLVAGMLAGTILVSPVGAHVTTSVKHLINKHLKKVFYTKKKADERYLTKTLAPRVAYGIDNADTQPATSPTVLAQTTISAPAPGFLVLQGSVDVYNSSGPEPDVACYIRLNATDLESSMRHLELNFSTNSEEDCETHTVAPVNAGSHSIQLRAESVGAPPPDTNYDNKVVSAIWIPYGATGASPTSFTLLRADQAGGSGEVGRLQERQRAA
jgi:hypothetical protein